jgi:hypothetical protein
MGQLSSKTVHIRSNLKNSTIIADEDEEKADKEQREKVCSWVAKRKQT